MPKKKILVVCGAGAATSTVVAEKVRVFLEGLGIDADLQQCKAAEAATRSDGVDLIVSTTRLPADFTMPVVHAVSLLTGVGVDATYRQIESALINP